MEQPSYFNYQFVPPLSDAFAAVNKMVNGTSELFKEYPEWQAVVEKWNSGYMSYDDTAMCETKIIMSEIPDQLKKPMLTILNKMGFFVNAFDYLIWRENDPQARFVRQLCNEIMVA